MGTKTTLNKKKKILAVISAVIAVAAISAFGIWLWKGIKTNFSSPEEFKVYIESLGPEKYLIALGIQFLQVVIAFIPGEIVEIGMGAAFGWFVGTLLCLGGVTLASSLIFLLTKTVGRKFVELFVDPGKIDELRFLNSEKKLKRTVFLLYFIPGTPKDLITYFIGLTRMKLVEFSVITTVARIPSVVSSTIGGHSLMERDFLAAILIFIATSAVSLLGIYVYNRILRFKRSRAEKHASSDHEQHD